MLNTLFLRRVRENLVFALYIFKFTIIFTMASIICSACSAVFNNSKAYTMHLSMSIHCGMSVVLSTAASSTLSKKNGGDKSLSQLDTAKEVTTKKDPKESFVDGNNMIAVSTAETHDVLLDNTLDDNVQTYPQPDNVMENEDGLASRSAPPSAAWRAAPGQESYSREFTNGGLVKGGLAIWLVFNT